jgi:predicted enzyme related to lactoylglutathione lyase
MAAGDTLRQGGLFRKVDCLRLPVPDLEAGLAFYRDALGHALIWRTDAAAGLRLPESESEIVLYTDGFDPGTDLSVTDVRTAIDAGVEAGGRVLVPAFEIQIGRCAIVRDPWGNALTIVDASKGLLRTDEQGRVTGNDPPQR